MGSPAGVDGVHLPLTGNLPFLPGPHGQRSGGHRHVHTSKVDGNQRAAVFCLQRWEKDFSKHECPSVTQSPQSQQSRALTCANSPLT